MSSLRERLSRVQSHLGVGSALTSAELPKTVPTKSWTAPPRYHALATAVQGRVHTHDAGSFCSRMIRRENADAKSSRDAFLFQSSQMTSGIDLLHVRHQSEMPQEVDLARIAFVDTETTGLGGSGAVPFVVGIGWYQQDHFAVEQYLLPDYADEAAMLEQVLADLNRAEAVVTYNGAAFDIPLLRDRFVIHRIAREYQPKHHLDLLHLSRRVFKRRLRDCSLGNLESTVLGHERVDDVPGYLIPATYFQWLNSENPAPLIGVLDHNADDIISLAALFQCLAQAVGSSGGTLEWSDDIYGLSRHFRRRRNDTGEFRTLQLIHGERPKTELSPEMTLAYARRLKQSRGQSDLALAVGLWEEVARGDCLFAVEANRQLAIHAERHRKNFLDAIRYVERGLAIAESLDSASRTVRASLREEMQNRRSRLLLKSTK